MDINTQITPSLHPELLKGRLQEAGLADEGILAGTAQAVTAFSEAYETLREIHDAREAAARNPAWTEGAQILNVAAFAEKKQAGVLSKFDAALKNLSTVAHSIEAELLNPVQQQAGIGTLNEEVRRHVNAIPDLGKRVEFIKEAIKSGDTLTATAVLGAPCYLSGLGAELHQELLRSFHESQNPLAVKRLNAARLCVEHLEKYSPMFLTELTKAVGADSRKVRELRKGDNQARAKLGMAARTLL